MAERKMVSPCRRENTIVAENKSVEEESERISLHENNEKLLSEPDIENLPVDKSRAE
jgi:hypothetical protein